VCVSRQTRQEQACRSYLTAKLHHLSPLKRKADAASITAIPLTTTHGGHPLHVVLVPAADKQAEEADRHTKRRRTQLLRTVHQLALPPPPPSPRPPSPLPPADCMTFRQLAGQLTHRSLRTMRSFLNQQELISFVRTIVCALPRRHLNFLFIFIRPILSLFASPM
jgi:hypothetical protein